MNDISTRWLIIHGVIWIVSGITAVVLQDANVMIAPVIGTALALTASGHLVR